MIADKIKIITKACFLYFFIHLGVINPILDKKKIMIGNSNKIPVARVIDVIVEIYDERSNLFTTVSLME